MAGDEDVIDNAVVRITPDLKGFNKSLQTQLNAELAKIEAKVKLVADKTGFVKSVYTELAKVKVKPQFKVKLVADTSGLAASARKQLAKEKISVDLNVNLTEDSEVDKKVNKEKAELTRRIKRIEAQWQNHFQRVRSLGEGVAKDRESAYAEQEKRLHRRIRNLAEMVEQAEFQAHANTFRRLRGEFDTFDKAWQDAHREEARRNKSAAEEAVAVKEAEEKKKSAIAEREAKQRVRIAELEGAQAAKAASRELDRRRKDFDRATRAPTLIDFGGEGVKPTNALLGAVVALSPALLAMGSSAVQAASSVAALGSAGIGAALGITSLGVSFSAISDVLKLRDTVRNQELAGGGAKAAAVSAVDTAKAQRNLADAQRDEKAAYAGIHDARREAIRDLQDLRQAVIDLDNQYKGDRLSVREAERDEIATNRNFFATALDRARAHQNTLDAKTRLSDTRLQRRQKSQELARSLKTGIEGSDKVLRAREQARDARDRRIDAQADTSKRVSAAMGGTSSAAAQLQKRLADLSPAGREMYYWFDRNEEKLKSFRRTIEQGTLPGFNKFLKAVISAPKGGKSTLELAAEYAAQLGGVIGKYVGVLGVWSKSPLFRAQMATIQTNNVKAFDALGKALTLVTRAMLRIFTAASPLLVGFADKVLDLASAFDKFIEKSENNGNLQKWFKDAAVQARGWWKILTSVAKIITNVFTASLPAGGSLVESLGTFLEKWANISGSATGQAKIKEFFDRLANLPYAQITNMLIQLGELFLAKHAAGWALANPVFASLGILIASNPGAATTFLGALAKTFEVMGGTIAAHPELTAILLAMVGVAKLNKSSGGLLFKFTGLDKVPGLGGSSSVMNVTASIVNVYGGAGGPGGAPAGPGGAPAGPGGPPGAPKGKPSRITRATNAVGTGNIVTAAALTGFAIGADELDRVKELLNDKGKTFHTWSDAITKKPLDIQNWYDTFVDNSAIVMLPLLSKKIFGSDKNKVQGAEQEKFTNLEGDLSRYGVGGPMNDSGVTRRAAVTEYIAARKKSVAALVEETRATKGDAAAKAVERYETERSVATLTAKLQQYGWAEGKAKSYASAVYNLNGLVYEESQRALAATGALDGTGDATGRVGKKARDAAADVKLLSEETDKLTGEKKIVLTVDGKKTVMDDLNQLAIYQQLLRTGEPPTQSNVNKYKRQFERQTFAGGGRVYGYSAHDKADNIPAMLTANEYVQPVSSVRYYGNDFMEAIRTRRFPRFAAGGPVAWPFATKIPPEAGTAVQSPYTAVPGGGTVSGSVQVAEIAEATARSMGATTKQLIALISAGLVESGMRNINYGDRDSVGFLQQRPSQGWGTVQQLLDPAYATTKFIQAARRYDAEGISAGELAARIQRPAKQYRNRYGLREADAAAILNRMPPFIGGGGGLQVGTPGAGGTKAGLIDFGRWLQARGYQVTEHPAFGGVGRHVRNSQHYRAQAIDVNHGAGTSAREQAFLRKILPEAHRRGFRSIFMTTGHYNHAHFDLGAGHSDGGLVQTKKFDRGGDLPPGYTLAYNGTGRNETVRTYQQEQQVRQGSMRLDRRDISLLAGAVTRTGAATVNMDGRRVAELTNRYNYLPAGM